MIILHDEETLLHDTVELLGAKLIPALESPARIRAIVKAIQGSEYHDLRIITASADDQETALELAKATHKSDYLNHIQNVFTQWLEAGLVKSHESVLPECFRLQNVARATLQPPKDIYARAGYYAFDMSTGITENSWKSIIASANLTVQAARILLDSANLDNSDNSTTNTKSVLALCRPPGHHCTGQSSALRISASHLLIGLGAGLVLILGRLLNTVSISISASPLSRSSSSIDAPSASSSASLGK